MDVNDEEPDDLSRQPPMQLMASYLIQGMVRCSAQLMLVCCHALSRLHRPCSMLTCASHRLAVRPLLSGVLLMAFYSTQRRQYASSVRHVEFTDLARVVMDTWRQLVPAERAPYEAVAAQEALQHSRAHHMFLELQHEYKALYQDASTTGPLCKAMSMSPRRLQLQASHQIAPAPA